MHFLMPEEIVCTWKTAIIIKEIQNNKNYIPTIHL